MKRLFLALFVLLCLLASAPLPRAAADEPAVPTYRVGYISVPGFLTKDADGHYRGSGYEYLEQLAIYAGCRFEYIDLSHTNTSMELLAGNVDLLIGSTIQPGDPRFLFSEHSIGRTPLQLSLASGVNPETQSSLRIGYISDVYSRDAIDHQLARFLPPGRYALLPYADYQALDQDIENGTLQGIANDSLHPQTGTQPYGNLYLFSHYILYRPDETALKDHLDDATNDMLTVTPFLPYLLAKRQEQKGAPLILTPDERAWLAAHSHIRAFASPNQPPYAYFENGEHKGVTQDILSRIEHDLGITFDITPTGTNEELFRRLDDGEADVMCDFFFDYNWAHEHHMMLTNPYLTVTYVLVHRRNEDIPSSPVIAAPRSRNFTRQYVERYYPEKDIRYCDTDEDCLRAVSEGQADIAAVKSIIAQALIYRNGFFRLEADNTVVYTQGTSIAVSERIDPIFVRILNKEIAHLDPTAIQSAINEETRATTEQTSLVSYLYRHPIESLGILVLIFLALLVGVLLVLRIRRNHLAEISRIAYTEPVTGLHNERWLESQLPDAIDRAQSARVDGRLYLVAICVRQMAYYRSTYSRSVLAESFVHEIQRAQTAFPWFRLVALSGDRTRLYTLWELPAGLAPEQAAQQVTEGASVIPFGDVMTRIRYHVSAVQVPNGRPDIAKLVSAASTTLDLARTENQPFLLFNQQMEEEFAWASHLETLAPKALARQEFSVWYQPKYDLATHTLVGAEALVRWQSPELGLLPPSRFIEVFERNGFAVRLDYYMLGHVARFLEDRLRRGLPVVPISVNQSALHIGEGGYLRKMKETAEAYGLPAGLIDLEVTETAFVDFKTKEARESSRHIIDSLKSYGYATSMDDFCTGYSSIAMLQNLPMDSMKIDRSILLAAEHDDRALRILRSVIQLGASLDMKILCEGIETEAQEKLLKDLGCTYGQGYLYAKPMKQEEFEEFMEKHLA